MTTKEIIMKTTIFQSEIMSVVETTDSELAKAIEWADANPVVWKIVTGTRSKAFGRNSCEYIGWAQGNKSPEAILERVRHFRTCLVGVNSVRIWGWRARFTLEHYRDKGFKGGFFQQWDENYPRACMMLDYTPETFEEVTDQFENWMDKNYRTAGITLDGKTVRTYDRRMEEEGGMD